jgi:hypothetical protein
MKEVKGINLRYFQINSERCKLSRVTVAADMCYIAFQTVKLQKRPEGNDVGFCGKSLISVLREVKVFFSTM